MEKKQSETRQDAERPIFPFTLKKGPHRQTVLLEVRRMFNAGYVGRNQEEVRRHIDELAKRGVPGPSSTPTLYPIVLRALTQSSRIEVYGEETSGEAEFVLLVENPDRVYVAAGSDHTARDLEVFDIAMSKTICPNVISVEAWLLEDALPGWDEIELRSWVTKDGKRSLYQETTLGSILPPADVLDLVRVKGKESLDHVAIYSGTIPLLKGEFVFGERFEVELYHPRLEDRLSLGYDVFPLRAIS